MLRHLLQQRLNSGVGLEGSETWDEFEQSVKEHRCPRTNSIWDCRCEAWALSRYNQLAFAWQVEESQLNTFILNKCH